MEAIKRAHLAGQLDIPGFRPIPETMPAASLEEPPVPPTPACHCHGDQEKERWVGEEFHLIARDGHPGLAPQAGIPAAAPR
eukprot:2872782-Lingulodinium_polyedra.AAC.1